MATSLQLLILCLSNFIILSQAQTPKNLLLPVTKDSSSPQYITQINLGTPAVSKRLVVDLGGRYPWVSCETGYNSSTYTPGVCGSESCSVAKANGCFKCQFQQRPGCNTNTKICSLYAENTVTVLGDFAELATDKISVLSSNGANAGSPVTIPNLIFACGEDSLLKGLAKGAKGIVALGRFRAGLPAQLSSAFGGSLPRKFSLCLPSSSNTKGVILFGNSPFVFYPNYNASKQIDVSTRLTYTKLYINPLSTAGAYVYGETSSEYFVGLKSITIDKQAIPINSTLLSFYRTGVLIGNPKAFGGTKISTVNPYTVLESSIYKAFTETFAKKMAALNVKKVASVAPFTECFSTEHMASEILGPMVPEIGFVFEKQTSVWGIYGYNSMVKISKDVLCLAFVDGGLKPRTSVVIGAHQLEENFLHFDLASYRLGFSGSLLWADVMCSNFKF